MITTIELLEIIKKEKSLTIETLLKRVPDVTFIDYLDALLQQKEISKSKLIDLAQLYRTYGYQILNGQKNPSKKRVIQIALALQLNENETNNLLSLSNNGFLYPKVKFDAAILFALKNQYSVMDTNLLLAEQQLPLLF